jgi:hypothetical protein
MPEEDTGVEPQATGQEPADESGQEPTTFTPEYVQDLRQEAAKYRTQLRDTKQKLEGFSDYDDLKAEAAEWQKHQDAQKGELEKLQEQLEEVQRERDDALQRRQDTLIQSAFVTAASAHNVTHPADAYNLADLSKVRIDDDGKVTGVKDQVEALVKDGRLPLKGQAQAPDVDGGVGTGRKGQKPAPTAAEIREQAAVYGVSPEQMAAQYGVSLGKNQ